MSFKVPPEIEAALAELRAEYLATLPVRVAEIAASIRLAREDPGQREAYASARTEAHRLRGTAGSYGFGAIGEAAGRIEDALPLTQGANAEERARAWSLVGEALSLLQECAAARVIR